jgi:hypothetical protein
MWCGILIVFTLCFCVLCGLAYFAARSNQTW